MKLINNVWTVPDNSRYGPGTDTVSTIDPIAQPWLPPGALPLATCVPSNLNVINSLKYD